MPIPPTPPTYWWLTVRIDACRTRDERVAAASGDDAVRMWRELHPNVEVIHVRPVPELVDIELEHMSTNNNTTTDPIRGVPPLLAARDALAERHRPDSWSPSTVEPERVAPKSIEERIAEADAAIEASMKRIRKIIATPARQLAADRARAALAEPVATPARPTDEELDAMERQCYLATEVGNDSGCEYVFEHRRYARAVLARFGHHFPDATKMVSDAYQMGRRDASADSQQAAEAADGDVAELVALLRIQGDVE